MVLTSKRFRAAALWPPGWWLVFASWALGMLELGCKVQLKAVVVDTFLDAFLADEVCCVPDQIFSYLVAT